MAITEEMVDRASEWEIRSLVSRTTFPIEGDLSDILSAQDMESRMGGTVSKTFSGHPIIGELLVEQPARVRMSVSDMVSRQQADLELIGGDMEMSYSWLQIPSDFDKLIIIKIVRRFIEYQSTVHSNNLSTPSEAELSDFKVLKQLHNYLVDDAEDWLNRERYLVQDAPTGDIESILNGGLAVTTFAEEKVGRKVVTKFDTGGFEGISDSATSWGNGIL